MTLISDGNEGLLTALRSRGVEDDFSDALSLEAFDARKLFLKGNYQRFYQPISFERHDYESPKKKSVFDLNTDCDFVNGLDIVVHNPERLSLNQIFRRIDIHIGGAFIDIFCCEDIDTQIRAACALVGGGRKVRQVGDSLFVPLCLAPLHDWNLFYNGLRKNGQYRNKMHIQLEYHPDVMNSERISIYGNRYVMSKDCPEIDVPHCFMTMQSTYVGAEKMIKGVNTFGVHHMLPVCLMYFWGFDKNRVKNVKLVFDGNPIYDGPLEPLENFKLSRGIDIEPVVIWFSTSSCGERMQSTVSASNIESTKLIIDTDQEEDTQLHIVSLFLQPFLYSDGLFGMKFCG